MAKKKIPPLLIDHIEDLSNMHLFSIIEYQRTEHVCIVDNITPSELRAFVIDRTFEGMLTRQQLISEAIKWYYTASRQHQLSVELARKGLTNQIGPLYRKFDLNNISRIVGQVFHYPDLTVNKVKRKRVVTIPEGIAIRLKKV